MGARDTALNALIACRKEGAWSNGVLKEYIRKDGLDSREAALASRLCYGILQNRMLLDFYLKQLLTGKLKNLHPVIRDVLHMGLYQLYFMDKIPSSAAVNEAVSQAKRYCRGQKNASALVNAVLRNAVRNRQSLRQPVSLEDKYSHPKTLIDLLGSYVGPEKLENMLAANNMAAPTVIQTNTLRVDTPTLQARLLEEGVTSEPHKYVPNCLVLGATGNLEALSCYREGLFYIQDAAAKLSVLCAGIEKMDAPRILDCCAAPGGKSFAAAIVAGNKGSLYSCDFYDHKVELIRSGAQRLGLDSIHASRQDARQPVSQWKEAMDVVIADVPCSGYGIIRKKPDIRYKDPASMEELPGLQLQILENQAGYVCPGGVLIYSTCTLLRRENEDIVQKFLQLHKDFYTETLPLPEGVAETSVGMLRLVPGEYDTDGFFICRLRRKV